MAQENTQPAEVIAKLLMITPRRLQQLHKESWIPKSERGRYPLVGAVQGYIRYLRDRNVGGDLDNGVNPQYERALLAREQRAKVMVETEKLELETAVLRYALIPAEEVERVWSGMIASFRAKCLSIPTKAAQAVITTADIAEAESILTDAIHEALAELADYDASQYNGAGPGAQGRKADSTAAEADGEPVGGRGKTAVKRGKRGTRPVEH